jgi:hypothetical protein
VSSFYNKAKPLIERVVVESEKQLQRITLNDGWIAQQLYEQRTRLQVLASELGAKPDGEKVRVDHITGSVNREEFLQHLERLAGESRETVWASGDEEL